MKDLTRLKNILLVAIVLAFFLAGGSRLYDDLKQHDLQVNDVVKKQLSTVRFIIHNTLKDMNDFYNAQTATILSDTNTVEAINTKDSAYLLAHLHPVYARLKKENPNLILFNIYDKNNRLLVDYHKSKMDADKRPENCFRKMIQTANKTLQTQYGVEDDAYDKNLLTYRIVTPVIKDGKSIGIIVFGLALDTMLPNFTKMINQAIGMPKHIRLAFKIKNGEVNFKNQKLFERIGDYSIPTSFSEVIDILKHSSASELALGNIPYHSKTLRIFQNSLHFKNFRSKNMASIIVIMDVTQLAHHRAKLINEGWVKPLIILTLVLLFFNIVVKRLESMKGTIDNQYTRLKSILDAQSSIVVISDGIKLLEANKAFFNFFHYETLEEFFQENNCICDFFQQGKNSNYIQAQMGGLSWSQYIRQNSKVTHKVKMKEHIFSINVDAYFTANSIDEFVVVFNDITALEQHNEQLHKLAYIDSLTKLPNRADFLNCLNQTLLLKKQLQNDGCALMFLDLDGFKRINDIYGHDVGDWLLKKVSSRMVTLLNPQTYIARLGGDEFVVLVDSFKSKKDISDFAKKILVLFEKEFLFKSHKLSVGASIGISFYPQNADDVSRLLKSADIAMYHAKESGKNRFEFYDESMRNAVYQSQEIEDDLKMALKNDELYLVYQPQVNIQRNKLAGVEVLIRWKHPTKGEIYPNQFIPIAEQSNLIIKIGEFVLAKAIEEIGSLINKYDFRLSVNTTNKELREDDFVDKIVSTCKEKNFDLHYLELEFIERDALEDITQIQKIIATLRDKGVTFALDDFGTGYSSLSYLNRLNVNVLKIDKSFIENIFVEKNRLAIVKSILAIAENINLEVVAEGVERKEEYDVLKALKCDIIQGYYLAKPMKLEALKAFITK